MFQQFDKLLYFIFQLFHSFTSFLCSYYNIRTYKCQAFHSKKFKNIQIIPTVCGFRGRFCYAMKKEGGDGGE